MGSLPAAIPLRVKPPATSMAPATTPGVRIMAAPTTMPHAAYGWVEANSIGLKKISFIMYETRQGTNSRLHRGLSS